MNEALFERVEQRVDVQHAAVKRSRFRRLLAQWRKQPLALIGAAILVSLVVLAIIGPHVVDHDPSKQSLTNASLAPSAEHWFGTDDLGRDMWARTWMGARISLFVGVVAASIDLVVGVFVGLVSGYAAGRGRSGDRLDQTIQRVMEVLYSIPSLLVIILLLVILKPGLSTMIIALSLTGWVGMARLVRGQILQAKEQEYILASAVLGASHWRIMFHHLLPNVFSMVIIQLTFTIPGAIFAESFLSFLGLGIQSPAASWGTMANDALGVILNGQWWRLLFPGLMISLTMFGFNTFGDGLQQVLDPRNTK